MPSGSVNYNVKLKRGGSTSVTSGAVNVKWTNDFDKQKNTIAEIERKNPGWSVIDIKILS
ncbi:MAG: hypothetical protein PHS54_03610 [Clostridia bacterium]|nr:hypothetical protein [Clostridia bacterium]